MGSWFVLYKLILNFDFANTYEVLLTLLAVCCDAEFHFSPFFPFVCYFTMDEPLPNY